MCPILFVHPIYGSLAQSCSFYFYSFFQCFDLRQAVLALCHWVTPRLLLLEIGPYCCSSQWPGIVCVTWEGLLYLELQTARIKVSYHSVLLYPLKHLNTLIFIDVTQINLSQVTMTFSSTTVAHANWHLHVQCNHSFTKV